MPARSSCLTWPSSQHLPPITATHAADLRVYLARIPDPRHRRGIRHPLTAILGITAAAVAAGARSFTAISEWAADAPQPVLASLGARFDNRQQRHVPPDETTLRRVLSLLDGDALDDTLTAWLNSHSTPPVIAPPVIAVDGKSLRGTFPRTGGTGVHLFAAFTHDDGIVLAQRRVAIGTSEIAAFQPLLDGIDLTTAFYQYDIDTADVAEVWRRGSVIASWLLDLTADALHSSPGLDNFAGRVSDSGEGRWTSIAAIDTGVPAPVLTTALYSRFASRNLDEFANKVLSAMRKEFGGHEERPA